MSEFKKYRRAGTTEMKPYVPGDSIVGVTISDAAVASGSPTEGDYIARDPNNHSDQWLVQAVFFRSAKFEEVTGD